MKKTLANEKKTGIQIHPRLFRGLYNIEKGNNHRKKKGKNSKMKFKKFKKKTLSSPEQGLRFIWCRGFAVQCLTHRAVGNLP